MTDAVRDSSNDMEPRGLNRSTRRRDKRDEREQALAFVYAVSGLLAVLLLVAAADLLTTWGRIHPGVRVSGVQVGGMARDKAEKAVAASLAARVTKPLVLSMPSGTRELSPSLLGARVDARASVEEAYSVGRRGSIFKRIGERLEGWLGRGPVVGVKISVEDDRLGAAVREVAEEVDVAPRDASVKIEGETATLVPSVTGKGVDRAVLSRRMLDALASRERIVRVTLETTRPRIGDEAARQALEDAQMMLSDEVVIAYEKSSWTVPAKDISGWIAFRSAETTAASETSTSLVAYLETPDVSATVLPMVQKVARAPKDARFVAEGSKVRIEPSLVGLTPNVEGLTAALEGALREPAPRSVKLGMKQTEPKVTTAKARSMGVVERISSYTTTYPSRNKPRVNNIHTLAERLDGALIAPGDTFSFNGYVGERTAAKGYQEAGAIVNGKLVPQLGGGICQVGTTIFNSVFFSGLPVVERHNHSQYISHYPTGRDATVSWGGPDFKFRNETKTWILIKASYTSSSLTISLYGTDPDYEVGYKTGGFTNVKPPRVEEIEDAQLPVGTRVIEDKGVSGRKVVVTRTVRKGKTVVRTDEFVSVYRPSTQVVRVGTKPPASTTPTNTPAPAQ